MWRDWHPQTLLVGVSIHADSPCDPAASLLDVNAELKAGAQTGSTCTSVLIMVSVTMAKRWE